MKTRYVIIEDRKVCHIKGVKIKGYRRVYHTVCGVAIFNGDKVTSTKPHNLRLCKNCARMRKKGTP